MQPITEALSHAGTRAATQAELWDDVGLRAESLDSRSATEAMADIFEQQAGRIEDYVKGFRPPAITVVEID